MKKKMVCCAQFLRGEDPPRHAGPRGEAPGSVGKQRGEERVRARACFVVSVGRNGQGGVSSLRIGYSE